MTTHAVGEFHYWNEVAKHGYWSKKPTTRFTYTFENFFHPFVAELIEQLNRRSLAGLFDPEFQAGLRREFFEGAYTKRTSNLVGVEHAPKELDLRPGGPYSNYNWELLFHVPMTIAVHLSKNQRFAEAQRWFHFVFDPTSNDTSTPVPQRFWRFLAFRSTERPKQIDEQLRDLSIPSAQTDQLLCGLEAIRNDPFQPHKVARTRELAYQYWVVMKYIDNLLAWGDSLFQQDTIESINEATQIYVLAANLLGRRPQRIPSSTAIRPRTFDELRKQGLDPMGNALVELEGQFPLNLGMPKLTGEDPDASGPLFGIGRALYFCIPRNEKLLGYWDTVADRLFKIRHCMNIQGSVRQLAFYEPPIDPGMLIRAAAAGIDVSSIVAGLNQPVSPVRASVLIAKAVELCAELRGLGAALLAAIEKGDSEHLAALRAGHEISIAQKQQEVRFLQWAAAQENTRTLLAARRPALERLKYYQRVLGLPADPAAPDELTVRFEGLLLTEENFAGAFDALVGQFDQIPATQPFPQLEVTGDGRARLRLTTNEDDEFEHLKRSRDFELAGSAAHALAASFVTIPDTAANLHFWGLGGTVNIKVGTALSAISRFAGNVLAIIASWEREQAGMVARTAAYERRTDEWVLQHNLAALELRNIGRQVLSSLISEQIAADEYRTLKKSIENSQEVGRYLQEKFTSEQLYSWLQGEISRIYYEQYRFALDTARKAERAIKHELMRPEVDRVDHIKFNYWDGGRRGLLSGEALFLDVKRMELAYLDNNKREFELSRHISLRQLDPAALLALRAGGACEVTIPEWVFDLETPGHYMRRLRSVGVTIPCVIGPYSNVSCTLTLTRSSLRTSPLVGDGYRRQDSEDARFLDYFSATESIVTSSAQNDSGLFESNLRDERLLPFEGAGAISTWRLELPAEFHQFDRATISDVVLHLHYTARQGGAPLRSAAEADLVDAVSQASTSGMGLLLSLKHDFPNEWSAFVNGDEPFNATLRRQHFPYMAQARTLTITGYELFASDGSGRLRHRRAGEQAALDTATRQLEELRECTFTAATDPPGPSQIMTRSPHADVWLVVSYTL